MVTSNSTTSRISDRGSESWQTCTERKPATRRATASENERARAGVELQSVHGPRHNCSLAGFCILYLNGISARVLQSARRHRSSIEEDIGRTYGRFPSFQARHRFTGIFETRTDNHPAFQFLVSRSRSRDSRNEERITYLCIDRPGSGESYTWRNDTIERVSKFDDRPSDDEPFGIFFTNSIR